MKIRQRNLFWAGFTLGLGALGAIDGIVFHQLLQWHHLIVSPNHTLEIISDGIFNILVTVLLVWTSIRLFRDAANDELDNKWNLFWGAVLIGGGTFNFVEGLIDHQILQIHHVKPGSPNQFLYDMLFLLSGIVLVFFGAIFSQMLKKVRAM